MGTDEGDYPSGHDDRCPDCKTGRFYGFGPCAYHLTARASAGSEHDG